jgi:hypothetical protein
MQRAIDLDCGRMHSDTAEISISASVRSDWQDERDTALSSEEDTALSGEQHTALSKLSISIGG